MVPFEKKSKFTWTRFSIYLIILSGCKSFVVTTNGDYAGSNTANYIRWKERNLPNITEEGSMEPNCTPPSINEFPPDLFTQEQRRDGAVVVHFIGCAYLLYALALVCDVYFVPSVERICLGLKLPTDIAGATFMAAATSSPEFFTNIVGTFITEGDIGVGTIVGSAVFNVLAVAACCGLATKKVVQLEWWPLTRDCMFYALSVILLIVFLGDQRIYWWESLILVLVYILYIAVMYFDARLKSLSEMVVHSQCKKTCCCRYLEDQESSEGEEAPLLHPFAQTGTPDKPALTELQKEPSPTLIANGITNGFGNGNCYNNNGNVIETVTYQTSSSEEIDKTEVVEEEVADFEEYLLLHPPFKNGIKDTLIWIVEWPIMVIFTFTIPDCRKEKFKKFYPLSFFMCVLWIGGLSYLVAFLITVIGFTLNLPDSVMGLTFLAAGTSLPEAVSSVIVTRQGHGSMGMSNSIGSNTFDILLCLGLPWLIQSSFLNPEHFVGIYSGGIEYSALILLASLAVLYSIFLCSGFRLGNAIGIISLLMYVVFLVISSLFELNVFFPVNLPTCEISV